MVASRSLRLLNKTTIGRIFWVEATQSIFIERKIPVWNAKDAQPACQLTWLDWLIDRLSNTCWSSLKGGLNRAAPGYAKLCSLLHVYRYRYRHRCLDINMLLENGYRYHCRNIDKIILVSISVSIELRRYRYWYRCIDERIVLIPLWFDISNTTSISLHRYRYQYAVIPLSDVTLLPISLHQLNDTYTEKDAAVPMWCNDN